MHAVPLQTSRIQRGECAARARSEGRSLEELAREMRDKLLRSAASAAHAHDIATGHTLDDVVETLLMRVLQGSDPEGLRGIPLRRGPYVRPLLHCTREQVVEYLESLGQAWREDPTNRDTGFLRNRVRHLLVPVLRKEFPGYVTGLLSLSKKLGHASDLARAQASLLPWQSDGAGFSIAAEAFFAAPVAVRAASLLLLYDRFRGSASPRRLPWRFLAPALREEDQSPGSVRAGRVLARGWILNGHGAVLTVRLGSLHWGPRIASQRQKGLLYSCLRSRGNRHSGDRDTRSICPLPRRVGHKRWRIAHPEERGGSSDRSQVKKEGRRNPSRKRRCISERFAGRVESSWSGQELCPTSGGSKRRAGGPGRRAGISHPGTGGRSRRRLRGRGPHRGSNSHLYGRGT